jgi:cell division protein FtsB
MSLSGENPMNFSKLSKEKRKQLAGVVVITILVIGALGYFLIKGGYQNLSKLDQKKQTAQQKLDQMQGAVKRSAEIEGTFKKTQQALAERELGMASGDLYSWMHGTLRKFQRGYKVEIPQISPVGEPTEVNLMPQFPYQQASLAVAGAAYYHDLGKFIADFENAFPLMRIVNLNLELNPTAIASDREKLTFRMDIVTLVKP